MCMQKLNNLEKFVYNCKLYMNWYEDKNYKIAFTDVPDVDVLNINKFVMSKEEIKDIKKKPYILHNSIGVYLEDVKKEKVYTFTIFSNYRYDGASIPRIFWRIIGSKGDVRFLTAALIHDVLCENHRYVGYDRYFADKIFERLLYVADTCGFLRWLMFHSVDNFQKFCGWDKADDDYLLYREGCHMVEREL